VSETQSRSAPTHADAVRRTADAPQPAAARSSDASIERLQHDLVACQRLATLGNLAAMAAHEFRNLMTPIVARCEAALTMDDQAFRQKTLERALIQAQRAIAVSEHLLKYAHDVPPKMATYDVAAAAREALDTLTRPLDKDNIKLTLDIPADLAVRAQRDLFVQVLLNLLLNARQAMQGHRGALGFTAAREGDTIVLRVSDTGVGFSPEQLEQVVNPFLAADPHAQANEWHAVGLGLSVCRLIAHQHGAALRADNNASGSGCTFTLRWPTA